MDYLMKNEITQDEMHAALTRAHELRSLTFFYVLKACSRLLKSYKTHQLNRCIYNPTKLKR